LGKHVASVTFRRSNFSAVTFAGFQRSFDAQQLSSTRSIGADRVVYLSGSGIFTCQQQHGLQILSRLPEVAKLSGCERPYLISRVGLGIVMCPLWRSAFGFACLLLFSHVFTGHRALGRLGRHCLARQFSRPKRYASCLGAYSLHRHLYGHTCHSSCFTRVAHMCHDMTGPATWLVVLAPGHFTCPLRGLLAMD
jgi:hypothetical protein